MSHSGNIAISVLIASILISLRTPGNIRSWSESARFLRSFLIITLCSLNCFGEDLAPFGSFGYLSYLTMLVAANLLVAQLQSFGSVWTGRRILPVTRLIASFLALLTAWHGQNVPSAFVMVTILAGLSHVMLARSETSEIVKNFIALQDRLTSLDASCRGITDNAGYSQTEARDKSREAG